MEQRKAAFHLEQLEPRLLLSASPLLPPVAALGGFQLESPVAVQGLQAGEHASIDSAASFSYNPAANVSNLFPVSASGAAVPATAPATGAAGVSTAQTAQPARSAVAETVASSSNTGVTVHPGATAPASSQQSSVTDQLTMTLNAAQPPPSSTQQTLNYSAGAGGSDLTLRLSATDPTILELVDAKSGSVVANGLLGNTFRCPRNRGGQRGQHADRGPVDAVLAQGRNRL